MPSPRKTRSHPKGHRKFWTVPYDVFPSRRAVDEFKVVARCDREIGAPRVTALWDPNRIARPLAQGLELSGLARVEELCIVLN